MSTPTDPSARWWGRGYKREPTIATTIRIPESVYYEARVLLADPRTGKIKMDTWGPLIGRLLRQWIDEQKVKAPNV